MFKLSEVLRVDDEVSVDYPFIEVRTIFTDGKGLREDVYFGACAFVGGQLVNLDNSDVTMDSEFDGWTTWARGSEGLDFNGTPVNMTVWKVVRS